MAPTFRDPGPGKASESASLAPAKDLVTQVLESLPFAAAFLPDDSSVPYVNGKARQILPLTSLASTATLAATIGASSDRLRSATPVSWDATVAGEERRRLWVTSSPLRTSSAGRPGALVIVQDVTSERDLKEMQTSFASTVAHELRTPLAAVSGFIDNLLDGIEGPIGPGQRECLERMSRINRRLLGLLDGLLRLAKLRSGLVPCRSQPVDVAAIVGESVMPFQRAAGDKGIRLTSLVSAALGAVHSDGDRIIQVLTNLISNALKHTPPDGEIVIRATALREGTQRAIERLGKTPGGGPIRPQDWIQITVEDTGEGISAEEIDRIFDPFYQAGKTSAGDSGVGLGLAICKEILRSLDGHIFVESRLGHGSSFTFVLPMKPRAAPADEAPAAGTGNTDHTGKENAHVRLG